MPGTLVAIEGGLFPPDLLDQIAAGEVEGQAAAAFGLDSSRRLIDEIQHAFSDARVAWDAFERRLEHSRESPTTLTRQYWAVPFLEILGFQTLEPQRAHLEAGEQRYEISHLAGDAEGAPPVHVVSVRQGLDARDGRRSPHSSVQEYLNRSDAVWGLVTNGERLRLLRDSERFSRPTYVEFDLRGIFEGNQYAEFALVYHLLHATRFPRSSADVAESWLERYFHLGIDQGGRVREKLRDGVEAALVALGNGFLQHPGSEALREAVRSGRLDDGDYYRQLLRLVYRLLFLMVAEERRLIFPEDGGVGTQTDVYRRYYSVSALRDRCERYFAGDQYHDLWLGLVQTFCVFRDRAHAEPLGLAPLDGELFGEAVCRDIEGALCTNEALLSAMLRLSTFIDDREVGDGRRRRRRRGGGVRRRVNYAALDVEEFGSVYESLLDFHPRVEEPHPGALPRFELVAGSERKQTGSYYTPPELVRELIESALVPVMTERLEAARNAEAKERALLDLRVLDPASGSGHFLLAAARRVAGELAKVRAGEDDPSPAEFREAMRDVIRHCVYAVDKNPLAVDLCKVALWIEGHRPGLPLSFLDSHVRCGDSLVGVFDLDVLAEGIPDGAYTAVTGDDKKVATAYRSRNRKERAGQMRLGEAAAPADVVTKFVREFEAIADLSDRTVEDVQALEETYKRLRSDETLFRLHQACDLWTAAFFSTLRSDPSATASNDPLPTTLDVRRVALGSGDHQKSTRAIAEATALSTRLRFFHWPLEFPDVLVGRGGFDVVLGNPPFLGGKRISTVSGDKYRSFVKAVFAPWGNTTDLCTAFLRRGYDSLRMSGHIAMVATNSIGQGDTRESGLAVLHKLGGSTTFARRYVRWPGSANVEVNLVAVRRGDWALPVILDGVEVVSISSRLDTGPEWQPLRLHENQHKAFIGSLVRGAGFILQPAEADRLLKIDPRNAECVFPYLTGRDVNSQPDQRPTRMVINFFDWPRERAASYSALFEIIERTVLPERLKIRHEASRTKNVTYFWRYDAIGRDLYESIGDLRHVLVRSRVSEYHMLARVEKGCVYADTVVVFAFDDDFHFAILQSGVHEAWVRWNASTMRTDVRYTPTDCFETFPRPLAAETDAMIAAARAAFDYHKHRQQVLHNRQIGLTSLYHLFHSPDCLEADIVELRNLHARIDHAAFACYGWLDLPPGHGFHEGERGDARYAISPHATSEVLRRLVALNEERARGSRRK